MASKSYNKQKCRVLMEKVAQAAFYAHELNLYLDTHPCDEAALELFEEAIRNERSARKEFEECCYPLRVACAGADCGEWDWLVGSRLGG